MGLPWASSGPGTYRLQKGWNMGLGRFTLIFLLLQGLQGWRTVAFLLSGYCIITGTGSDTLAFTTSRLLHGPKIIESLLHGRREHPLSMTPTQYNSSLPFQLPKHDRRAWASICIYVYMYVEAEFLQNFPLFYFDPLLARSLQPSAATRTMSCGSCSMLWRRPACLRRRGRGRSGVWPYLDLKSM